MKLAAICNHWTDSEELLSSFIQNASEWADEVIIVVSSCSNTGEKHYSDYTTFAFVKDADKIKFVNWHPNLNISQRENETNKRNYGIDYARFIGCTHFVTCDTDERYDPGQVSAAQQLFDDKLLNGLVVSCQTYFAKPWLTIGLDTTLVPFIHKLTPTIRHEFNRKYPHAWIDGKIRIDPTRSMNITDRVLLMPKIVMHHYSWIRRDYQLKIRNSTARVNLERSTILHDLESAKEGYFCQFYGKTLTRSDVDFGIPDLSAHVPKDIQPR